VLLVNTGQLTPARHQLRQLQPLPQGYLRPLPQGYLRPLQQHQQQRQLQELPLA
jgi:hypothetical protein